MVDALAIATVAERQAAGRAARKMSPRTSHGSWNPASGRADPLALLRAQDDERVAELVPIRWGRMAASPLAFFRGSAALMAADLAMLPSTSLIAQLCGDAHLANFGLYGSPERELLFDVNDFDETLPGPFEWDLKRLAVSLVLASRANGSAEAAAREIVLTAMRSYREHMTAYADMRELEVWYSRIAADDLLRLAHFSGADKVITKDRGKTGRRFAERELAQARRHDSLRAAGRLTELADGARRIVEEPPLIVRLAGPAEAQESRRLLRQYKATLEDDRRVLLEQFTIADVARKVVGVGSVGTRCYVVLLLGRDVDDPLLLQVKEARPSVLEPYLGRSRFVHSGHRVVAGQRLMQAASDIFLGWMSDQPAKSAYYVRQLRDMKGTIEADLLGPRAMEVLAKACGWALARGHARSGQRVAMASYLGGSGRFDRAIAGFAKSYADQVERDYDMLLEAIKLGRIPVERGV
jgi:uncharacterized protein (DUF2252 family)